MRCTLSRQLYSDIDNHARVLQIFTHRVHLESSKSDAAGTVSPPRSLWQVYHPGRLSHIKVCRNIVLAWHLSRSSWARPPVTVPVRTRTSDDPTPPEPTPLQPSHHPTPRELTRPSPLRSTAGLPRPPTLVPLCRPTIRLTPVSRSARLTSRRRRLLRISTALFCPGTPTI